MDDLPVVVTLGPPPPRAELSMLWRRLEADADPSFFLSWTWIACWLAESDVEPLLLRVERGGQTVGLALFGHSVARRRGMRLQTLHLHETGDLSRDMIAIEYNGILADRRCAAEVVAAAMGALNARIGQRVAGGWDELRLSGLSASSYAAIRCAGTRQRLAGREVTRYVDLGEVRAAGGDYFRLLSRNTRQQLRRAMRLYETRGPLELAVAQDVSEAHAFFAAMEEPHRLRWESVGRSGAFASPFFKKFHHALIERAFEAGETAMLRVTAGTQVLGYLYCFVYRGIVYSYQNGFFYENDSRYKPGLVCHALAVAHYAARGHDRYDFMAGDSQYKRSLATASEEMYWPVLQSGRWPLLLERWIRSLHAKLRGTGEKRAPVRRRPR